MLLYRILLVIDLLVAALCLLLVGVGLYDGTGDGSTLLTWGVIVAVIAAIIWAATRLAARGHVWAANILLALIALAASGVVLFFYAVFRAFSRM